MPEEPIYTRTSQMEPMLPSVQDASLTDLAVEVIRQSAALSATLHPTTRKAVVELVRSMNSYYSNLIEGHNTHPVDIERALAEDYSHDPAKRALQMESAAHVEVQKLIEARLADGFDTDICAPDFLSWIHREFYLRLPDEFLHVKTPEGAIKIVTPGELRQDEVTVGLHIAPGFGSLPDFLARFQASYGNPQLSAVNKVVAAAASHHRLAWIHPFLDGNGRVTRLFTHAYLVKAQIDGHGMWTVSRGLARKRSDYLSALAGADNHRQGVLDGRGSLSNHGLVNFCTFFLEMALDQIKFMSTLLDIDGLQKRIIGYVNRQTVLGELQPESGYLLREVLMRGEVPRGEASRITGKAERTARRILKDLLEKKLLSTETEKGPVRLSFPTRAVGYYFPRLYPEGVELSED
ncbi:MAG: Fic family protein [Desulfuromonadales bacterium]